jgi:two-component system, NtrC family, sensor histidine kinase HydH
MTGDLPADKRRWLVAGLAGFILTLSALHQMVPLAYIQLHNFLQHLYFLPIVVAGVVLGWRASLLCTVGVGITQAPHIATAWSTQPVYAMDLLLEGPVFCIAGMVAGLLADRERRYRASLEMTKRQLEQVYLELQQNVERLKKAERLSAAGQLSAGLAHEIRNPLASICGAAGILKRGNASGEGVVDCLSIIDVEAQRLNRLLTSFLQFARPRPPRMQAVEVSTMIDSVLVLADHAHRAQGVTITKEIGPGLPEIEGDPEQLKQVLLNLLLNAIQATPGAGSVRVGAALDGDSVKITVRDEGPGIPDVDLPRIFEPFFTTKEHGTGLGLAVSAQIVEQHGGRLSAQANSDRGMTFHLDLPLRRSVAA